MSLFRRFRLSRDTQVTVANLVDELLGRLGDCEVSVGEEGRFHLSELHGDICAIDAFLRRVVALKPGEPVAIYRTNNRRCFHWFLAIIRAGGIAVPLNPLLSAVEVRRVLAESGTDILVTDTAVFKRSVASREALPVRVWIQADEEPETLEGFLREESAGAAFARRDGTVWTTDKDGIIMGLLAAEITARMGCDPAEIYKKLTRELGEPVYDRVDAPATAAQKAILKRLSPKQVRQTDLAGERIKSVLTNAPGNEAPIGGLKVIAENGWFAARPSGTESIYKIYAESFRGTDHLRRIIEEAQTIVGDALAAPMTETKTPGGSSHCTDL